MLGYAALVGIVAGMGGIGFYLATQAVEDYAVEKLAGYHCEPRPAGEPRPAWLPAATGPLHPWLLLVIPAVGGLLSGVLVFSLAPEAEGHGTDAVIAAYHHK